MGKKVRSVRQTILEKRIEKFLKDNPFSEEGYVKLVVKVFKIESDLGLILKNKKGTTI